MTDRLTEYSISMTNSYAVITDFECADKITPKYGRKCILTRLYEDPRSVMMLAVADGNSIEEGVPGTGHHTNIL